MRWISRGLIGFLLIYLALVVYTNRAIFFSSFDSAYWKDKFEHSQWVLPLSVRTIGDDGLYLWVGYRLIHGADPTLINAEAPPLGKYLIGSSIQLFDNGYVYGFLSTSLILILSFALSQALLRNRFLALGITALIATDPLITSQFPLTMLDSIQAVFFLLFLWMLVRTGKRNARLLPLLAGVTLGLFSETKFPILTPFFTLLGTAYIWMTYRSVLPIIWFGCGIAAGYILPYVPYFLMGHSLLDWLRVQKWIISFYRHARLTPTWGSALANLLVGKSQNIFSREWTTASHWSLAWTGITLASILGGIRSLKSKNIRWMLVTSIALTTIVIYDVVPFWTRYFVLLLPLLYLIAASVIAPLSKKLQVSIIALFLCCNVTASIPILFPTPEATVNQIAYNWEHMFFQDMYKDITKNRQTRWDSIDFRTFAMTTFADAQIESIGMRVTPTTWQRFVPRQMMHVAVTYYTRNLGPFTEEHDIPLVEEDGRWRVPWDWSMMIHDLTVNRRLRTTIEPARRGGLLASDGAAIAEDVPSDMIWVTQKAINPRQEAIMLKYLEGIFDGKIAAVYIHQRIYGNALTTIPIAIGVPPLPLTPMQRKTLAAFPGITLTPALGRFNHGSAIFDVGGVINTQFTECCSRLYTTTTYGGQSGAELEKNSILKGINGGALVMTDEKGNIVRTLLEVNKKDGQDTVR